LRVTLGAGDDGEVAHAAQQAAGDARRAARAAGDLVRAPSSVIGMPSTRAPRRTISSSSSRCRN
jgi:hypothetical protein